MLAPGRIVDRYTVDAELGAGGVATVYRVRHNQLGSTHALKVLQLHGANIRDRLIEEGKAQATLKHPNIVSVTDVIDVDGSPGLIMEYVDGPSLDRWLHVNRPSIPEAEALFRGILAGVARAHRFGLVHRDLKPGNVLLEPTDDGIVPKVADFGLAKALIEHTAGRAETRSGIAMGTPAYMAPEQVRDAKNVDQRADVFALGCILYELLVGISPFDGPDVLSIFSRLAAGTYTPAEEHLPELPPRLRATLAGCLANRREERIPDCTTLRAVLDGAPYAPAAPVAAAGPPLDVTNPSVHRSSPTFVAGAHTVAEAVQAAVRAEAPLRAEAPAPPPTVALSQLPPTSFGSPPSLVPPPEEPGRARVGLFLAGGGLLFLGGAFALALVGFGWWWLQGRVEVPSAATPSGPAVVAAPTEPVPVPTAPPDAAPPETPPEAPPETPDVAAAAGTTAAAPSGAPPRTGTTTPERTPTTATKAPARAPTETTPAATGTVTFTGDAEAAWLEGPEGRVGPGAVAAGDYRVKATFGGTTVSAGRVTVSAGKSITIKCDANFQRCVAS